MPFVSRKCIETIKEHVNIYDVVSPYVTLKKTGSSWRGLSPFNQEKTPSFYVLPEKNIFKCFSSGHAGDIFRFLELKENLSFQEAIETIAHRFKITLEYKEGTEGDVAPNFSLKKEIFDIHEIATEFFHKCFLGETEEGTYIRNYWENKRKFSLEVAKMHKVGYAPTKGSFLMEYLLKQKKFSVEALQQCGLFYAKEYDRDALLFKPRFRGRLIIPINDVQSRTIAFAGRQLEITPEDDPSKEAKYINSPETPIFTKGKTLFGIHIVRKYISDVGYFILVEGQLDTLRCWENGFLTTIAPQGTGITDQQLSTLKRYSNKLICVLDGDIAGQKAALRLLPMALKAGLEIQFMVLADGIDPDSFLLQKGADEFRKRINTTETAMQFCTKHFLPDTRKATTSDKSKALTRIYDIIVNCDSEVAQEDYLQQVCYLLQINLQSVKHDFYQYKREKNQTKGDSSIKFLINSNNNKLTSVEYQLLLIILNDEKIGPALAKLINSEWIQQNSTYARLLIKVIEEIKEDLWENTKSLDKLIENEEERNVAYSMLSEPLPFEDIHKAANTCLKFLHNKFLDEKKREIDIQIATSQATDAEQRQSLHEHRIEIRKALNNPPQIQQPLNTFNK